MLFNNNPLSAVTSIICPYERNCTGHCVLGKKGQPVEFYKAEQYISRFYLETFQPPIIKNNGKKVAVVGAGPAGITMSIILASKGYSITLFEAMESIGGTLRYGIPEFRLPKSMLDLYKEILDSQVTGQKKVRFIKSYICRTMHTITAFSYVPKQIILLFLLFSVLNAACKKNNDDQNLPDVITESLLPDTGQLKSYTSTPGEDADFIINPPSYTDNGNGTITDNVTGLMWQKTDGGEMTFENASSYCLALELGGFSDWRLPVCNELFDMIFHTYKNFCL